jgi:hypothetical protein
MGKRSLGRISELKEKFDCESVMNKDHKRD